MAERDESEVEVDEEEGGEEEPSTEPMIRAFIPELELEQLHDWMAECIKPARGKSADTVKFGIDVDEAEIDAESNRITIFINVIKLVGEDKDLMWEGEAEFYFRPDTDGSGFLLTGWLEGVDEDNSDDKYKFYEVFVEDSEIQGIVEGQKAHEVVQSLPVAPAAPAAPAAPVAPAAQPRLAPAPIELPPLPVNKASTPVKFTPVKCMITKVGAPESQKMAAASGMLDFKIISTANPTEPEGQWLIKATVGGEGTIIGSNELYRNSRFPNRFRMVVHLGYGRDFFGHYVPAGVTYVTVNVLTGLEQFDALDIPTYIG